MSQVETHNSESDCWMILHEIVYDLTDYADAHPAGPHYVWDRCGTKQFLHVVTSNRLGTIKLDENEQKVEKSDTASESLHTEESTLGTYD